uniref:L1 transposable element RRM domain-containing protein n=1 Tax=Latimeria chalumnae TaxID=7897 RepID=H3AKF2_LATCH
ADLHSEVSSVNTKLDSFSKRRIGEVEDWVYHLENMISEVHHLQDKCDDLENRACRSNLRIMGLPEGVEGKDPIAFVEKFLVDVLGEETFPGWVEVERAHHALRPRPRDGERPRILILKLLRYPDKVCILRKARELGQLTYLNQKIFFFPDVSAELQARRREFTEARQLCHSLQISFSLLHPAKLSLSLKDGPRFFTDPVEAVDFLKRLPESPRLGRASR